RFSRDWSSDVCSSDLMKELADKRIMGMREALELLTSIARGEMTEEVIVTFMDGYEKVEKTPDIKERLKAIEAILKRFVISENERSEERRVGKEWRSE